MYASTAAALGNGRGDQQRRNAHLPRQALRATLLRGLAQGTVRWGHRLAAFAEDAEGVTLRFAGGGEARAAVLVGCDGIWSSVRKQRLAAAECPPRYMGVVVVLGRAPCAHPLAQEQVLQTVRVRVRVRVRVPRVTLT